MITRKVTSPAGNIFKPSNMTNDTPINFCSAPGGRIYISLDKGGTSGRGIWYSDDDGINWTQTSITTGTWSICVTSTGRVVIARMYGKPDAIKYSDDGGITWQDSNSAAHLRWQSLCILPTGRILAGSNGSGSGYGVPSGGVGIYYSDDNGATWAQCRMTSETWSLYCLPSGKVLAMNRTLGIWYSDNIGTDSLADWIDTGFAASYLTNNVVLDPHIVTAYNEVTYLCNFNNNSVYKFENNSWTSVNRPYAWYGACTVGNRTVFVMPGQAADAWYLEAPANIEQDDSSSCDPVDPYYWQNPHPQYLHVTPTGRVLLGTSSMGVFYSDPEIQMNYTVKPFTGKQAKELVQQCKAYVQSLKNGN